MRLVLGIRVVALETMLELGMSPIDLKYCRKRSSRLATAYSGTLLGTCLRMGSACSFITAARQALLDYCHLDTLAMVKVWEKLIIVERGELRGES